jgi:hypothetical protein
MKLTQNLEALVVWLSLLPYADFIPETDLY